jgi:hypothetical protein
VGPRTSLDNVERRKNHASDRTQTLTSQHSRPQPVAIPTVVSQLHSDIYTCNDIFIIMMFKCWHYEKSVDELRLCHVVWKVVPNV